MFDTPHERKILLIGSSLLNTLCFSGIIFGWAPLSVMLEDEGQYSEVSALLQQELPPLLLNNALSVQSNRWIRNTVIQDCDVSGRGVAPVITHPAPPTSLAILFPSSWQRYPPFLHTCA